LPKLGAILDPRQLSAASSCHLLIMKVLRTDIVQRLFSDEGARR
jgi:hypothetical protein